MARLSFSNVPTAGGGVISGDISTGAGSPFGAGGKYEEQVASIQATIASAPAGTYDPKYWDSFLEIDPEVKIPEGFAFVPANHPSIASELMTIPTVKLAMEKLSRINCPQYSQSGRTIPQQDRVACQNTRKDLESTIALYAKRLLEEKNAPLIKAVEEHERQLEIDRLVQIALEQKIRETTTPTPTPTTPAVISSFPIIPIIIIAVIVGFFLLRRRA